VAPAEGPLSRRVAFAVVLLAGLLVLSGLFIGPAAAEETKQSVDGVLARLSKTYSSIDSLEAGFTQTSSGMSYASPMVQTGRVYVERPQKMHWDFQQPTPQQYISDGSTFWWVDHSSKTTTVYRQMDSVLKNFFDLLTGLRGVKENFKVSLEDGSYARPGSDSLKLVPRQDTSGMGTLYVHVGKQSSLVVGVTNVTAFGDTTLLELSEATLNKKLPESHFRWSERAGFKVIEGG